MIYEIWAVFEVKQTMGDKIVAANEAQAVDVFDKDEFEFDPLDNQEIRVVRLEAREVK